MQRTVALAALLLFSGAAACVSTGRTTPLNTPPGAWRPVTLSEISDPHNKNIITDLLSVSEWDMLWPHFIIGDYASVLVDSQTGIAYCVGTCVPDIEAGLGTSRVWQRDTGPRVAPGQFQFGAARDWGLRGGNEVIAIGLADRTRTLTVLVHESFHLQYETRYALNWSDDVGDVTAPSGATRQDLERHYSVTPEVASQLRAECEALVTALASQNRTSAFAALRRFTEMRDARRAASGAPSFEEDFWERQEGIPANLERRTAQRLGFRDPSVIDSALIGGGCDAIPEASYVLLLGGLQSAILDRFASTAAWPLRVYPTDGSRAASLYQLIRALLESTEAQ
jgi:hypothetical protein